MASNNLLRRIYSRNESLHFPLFRRYLAMRFLIILALLMQFTIVNYWVYKLSGDDVLAVGKLGLCEAIPAVLCSLFSGHFVDQNEKKKLLTICVGSYLLLAAGFVALSTERSMQSLGAATIENLIYLGTFIGGVLRSLLSPTQFSLMGLLLPREKYANATTWSSTAWQIGSFSGPLIAGFLIGSGARNSFQPGLWLVLGLEIVAFVIVLSIPVQPILKKVKEPVLKGLREGLKFVFSTQIILAALSLDMFAVLFGGAQALLPDFKEKILNVTGFQYGCLQAAESLGAITTLFLLSIVPLKKKPGPKLLLFVAGFGVCIIIFGLSKSFWLSFAMLYIAGLFDGVSVVIRGTILQLNTPDEMRGRVSAVNTMFISSSNEIGRAESGLTARWMGTVPAVVFGGCMTLLVVFVTWFVAPALRLLKLTPNDAEKKEAKT